MKLLSAAFLIGAHIKVRPKITEYGSISQFFFSPPMRNAALGSHLIIYFSPFRLFVIVTLI